MPYEIEQATWQALPVVTIRTRTSIQNLPAFIGEAFRRIGPHIGKAGVQPTDAPMVIFHNQDMNDLDVEVGFVLAESVPDDGDIESGTLPTGPVISTVFKGPYPDAKPAYDALEAWIAQNGATPTGDAYEFYLNDPAHTAPEDLLTRIVLPLR